MILKKLINKKCSKYETEHTDAVVSLNALKLTLLESLTFKSPKISSHNLYIRCLRNKLLNFSKKITWWIKLMFDAI